MMKIEMMSKILMMKNTKINSHTLLIKHMHKLMIKSNKKRELKMKLKTSLLSFMEKKALILFIKSWTNL
jgi:hypothetical protein